MLAAAVRVVRVGYPRVIGLAVLALRAGHAVLAADVAPLVVRRVVALGERFLVVGEADVFLSAGSTGALLAGGLFILGRIQGIDRPTLATVYPVIGKQPSMLVDTGANAECKPNNLLEFATMGSIYMERVIGRKNPTVGLVNNGTEDHKGDPLHQEAHELLKALPGIDFVGNIEGRDIMSGDVDVAVCDGFSGNIALKTTEGTAMALMRVIKDTISSSLSAKIGYALFMKKAFRKIKRVMDYSKYGGAVLLGIEKPVVKSHGSSKADSVCASVLQAKEAAARGLIPAIAEMLSHVDLESIGGQ